MVRRSVEEFPLVQTGTGCWLPVEHWVVLSLADAHSGAQTQAAILKGGGG